MVERVTWTSWCSAQTTSCDTQGLRSCPTDGSPCGRANLDHSSCHIFELLPFNASKRQPPVERFAAGGERGSGEGGARLFRRLSAFSFRSMSCRKTEKSTLGRRRRRWVGRGGRLPKKNNLSLRVSSSRAAVRTHITDEMRNLEDWGSPLTRQPMITKLGDRGGVEDCFFPPDARGGLIHVSVFLSQPPAAAAAAAETRSSPV